MVGLTHRQTVHRRGSNTLGSCFLPSPTQCALAAVFAKHGHPVQESACVRVCTQVCASLPASHGAVKQTIPLARACLDSPIIVSVSPTQWCSAKSLLTRRIG